MIRWFCLSLLLAIHLVATPPEAVAAPAVAVADAFDRTAPESVTLVGERSGRYFFWRRWKGRKHGKARRRGEHKSLGARFWGGPYWGYGARLGHPCKICRKACRGGKKSARCNRCRSRCGW